VQAQCVAREVSNVRTSQVEHAYEIFFFQAEDGIRDRTVTGVQTCALPIWSARRSAPKSVVSSRTHRCMWSAIARSGGSAASGYRSEERRVGKECRSRWAEEESGEKRGSRAGRDRTVSG